MKLEVRVVTAITDGVFAGESVLKGQVLSCDNPCDDVGSEEFNRVAALLFGRGNAIVVLPYGDKNISYIKRPGDIGTVTDGLPVSIAKYKLMEKR